MSDEASDQRLVAGMAVCLRWAQPLTSDPSSPHREVVCREDPRSAGAVLNDKRPIWWASLVLCPGASIGASCLLESTLPHPLGASRRVLGDDANPQVGALFADVMQPCEEMLRLGWATPTTVPRVTSNRKAATLLELADDETHRPAAIEHTLWNRVPPTPVWDWLVPIAVVPSAGGAEVVKDV